MQITLIFFLLMFNYGKVAAAPVEMNGIQLMQYGDFTNDWKLITVRFRQDTKEMRTVYANPIALDALKKGIYPFPEGSAFGKVGLKTGVDPAFNTSIVPSGARRFQLMVKNTKKYPDTDGWGYALFQSDGELYPGDMKNETASCHACHKLVPERNFVFSELVGFSPKEKHVAIVQPKADGVEIKPRVEFEEMAFAKTTGSLKPILKSLKIKKVRIISGNLRKTFFSGTLDEITPLLINELAAAKNDPQLAVGFISEDHKTFKILINKIPRDSNCPDSGHVSLRVFEASKGESQKSSVSETAICSPLNEFKN